MGNFPVLNTEKGGLRPTFSTNLARFCGTSPCGCRQRWFSPECNSAPRPKHGSKGFPFLKCKPYCAAAAASTAAEFTLSMKKTGRLKYIASGKSEHASTPEKGNNAITALLTLLAALPLAAGESASAIRALNKLFPHGDYYGKALGIAQADEISGALTVSFNIFEQTLTGFQGRFDSRTPLCTTSQNSLDIVKARFEPLGITTDGHLSPPHHTPADSPFIKTLLAAYEQYTAKPGYCEYIGGGTYVHGIEGGVCFGATMPGFEPNIHGADERIPIHDLITAAKIFTQVIVDICS